MVKVDVVKTARIKTGFLSCGDPEGQAVIFIHGNLSSSVFWKRTMATLPDDFYCVAPDLRGFGETEALKVDATLGLDDMALDVLALGERLGMERRYVVGHSMGGGVAMKMMLLRPDLIAGVVLVNTISPYGYAGSKDEQGTPCYLDGSPGGAGSIDPEFIKRLESGDRSKQSPVSPRNIIEQLYFKPPFVPRDMDALLDAVLSTRVGDDWYPGNVKDSPNCPGKAPGERGIVNAFSRRYFNASGIVDIQPKPPVLWLRGADDLIISDNAAFEIANLGAMGQVWDKALDWPGADVCHPQPMLRQIRVVLEDYRKKGGIFREQVIRDAGHTPFIEKPVEFNQLLLDFLGLV